MKRCLLVVLAFVCTVQAEMVRKPAPVTIEGSNPQFVLPMASPCMARLFGFDDAPRPPAPSLDEVFCTHDFAPLEATDSVVWQFETGNSIAMWVRSGGCPSCEQSEPIRVEALFPVFVRPDGSPADTLDLDVSVHCAVDELDSCSGVGPERGTRSITIPFDEDVADGIDQLSFPYVPFAGILADSVGAFVYVTNRGFRGASSSVAISADETNMFPLADCEVLVGNATLESWNQTWGDTVGGPRLSVGWSCDLDDTTTIPTCPDSCSFTRFSGPQAYFDPFTSVVYQWIEPAAGQLPLTPQSLDLTLYFEAVGNATDRAYFRVLLSCSGFGDICCPPGEPLCTIPAFVERGSQFQTVLDVTVPLYGAACCLNEPFWLGVVIDSVTGGAARPSFLYSSADLDPNPPLACEQWSGSAGSLRSVRQDGIAWADMRLNALCGSCGESAPQVCVPESHLLDCASASYVACSEDGMALSDQTIPAGLGTASRYCCSDLAFTGHEKIYRMQIPNQGNLRIQADTSNVGSIALFLLESCNTQNCVAFGIDSLVAVSLTNGEYIIVAESFDTEGLSFGIEFTCIADCNGEICQSDLRGSAGVGNRYLDAEGDGIGNVFFQSYYPGTGTDQSILRFNTTTCDSLSSIVWQSIESSPNRMLAYDPRSGGQFWCGTTTDFFSGTGRLYRISSGGGVVQSWMTLPGLPIMRWSGAAFDPTHNHMWVLIRDSSNTGSSRAYELDLSNPLQPVVIQGPHALPHQSPNQSLSCAGADYAQLANHLFVVHQGMPDDFVQCYEDLDPAYSGPRPGPGFVPVAWCAPDSNSLQGYGVAAIEDTMGGRIAMTNFTDADWTHPVTLYPPPCRLTPPRCIAPSDLAVFANGSLTRLTWTATYPGMYDIYSSVDPNNDGDPDGGTDLMFTREISLTLAAGSAEWVDTALLADFKVYAIVLTCSSGTE